MSLTVWQSPPRGKLLELLTGLGFALVDYNKRPGRKGEKRKFQPMPRIETESST